ncbi:MAG: DsrE/DsrF/DrsH-like family protein [Anaerovoracaceae bacterium]
MGTKTVIIGGVAGGATAAARLRRLDEDREIIMLERGGYISYANCGLPYYIGDVIKSRDLLLLQKPEVVKARFNIDVRIYNEATKIDRANKVVQIKNLQTGEVYEESYDNLIIATGSSPLKPPIEGIDGEDIYTLWTIPDTDTIREFVDKKAPKTAAVIGGGFIGLEMAENLHKRGVSVSIIEAQNQVMAPVDFEIAQLLHENMSMNDVNLILGDGVKSFQKTENGTTITLASGKTLEVDLVILSIGVKPNSTLAKEAGLELNQKGGIVVNSQMQTSDSNIYAVGDVVEIQNLVTKTKGMIPLAGPANKQARIVANILAGKKDSYKGTLGTSVAQVFDLVVAAVGVNEKTLNMMGKVKDKDYFVALINQKSHAGYYPAATPLTLKLIFDTKGAILGGQIVGQDGVDKRIDTIATTMRLGGNVSDLAELELAYAPPFSSAKDPVNMLGFVALNILDGLVKFVTYDQLQDKFLLDITETIEFELSSISGAHHIPLGELRQRLAELPKDKEIVTLCAIGVRSYNAARILNGNGFNNVSVLAGGTSFYKSMNYVKKEPATLIDSLANTPQSGEIKILDCCGLQCPGPIMKVNEAVSDMETGDTLKVSATDMGFARDVEAWCKKTGNQFIKTERQGKENIVTITKGQNAQPATCQASSQPPQAQGKSMIVFDGDMDKVLASFIIANGAAAMGSPVTMFFTFWGLNALRKPEKQNIKKPFIEKMFGAMMPRGASKLKLSNMNMGGMGTKMMKKVMKDKNVSSLEELMKHAQANGVKLVACTMSMDVMGITKEELIDGVELAGVASYLGDAEASNVNLFI